MVIGRVWQALRVRRPADRAAGRRHLHRHDRGDPLIMDHVKPLDWLRAAVEILADSRVSDSTRSLAMVMAVKAPGVCRKVPVRGGETGWDFYAPDTELIRLTGLSRTSIYRAKCDLIDHELVEKVSVGRHTGDGKALSSVYRLMLPTTQDRLPM